MGAYHAHKRQDIGLRADKDDCTVRCGPSIRYGQFRQDPARWKPVAKLLSSVLRDEKEGAVACGFERGDTAQSSEEARAESRVLRKVETIGQKL